MSNIERLTTAGILVDPAAADLVEKLSEKQLGFFIKSKNKPLILQKTHFKSFQPKIDVKIDVEKRKSIQDFINLLNSRFSLLQRTLMAKSKDSNMVSIKSASEGAVSIIGLIKTVQSENSVVRVELEDQTGTIKVSIQQNLLGKVQRLFLDEVVQVSGKLSSGILYAEKLEWPDIQLTEYRKPDSPSAVFLCFSSTIPTLPEKADSCNVLVSNQPLQPSFQQTVTLTTTTPVKIEGINTLFYMESTKENAEKLGITEKEFVLECLKRRHFLREPCLQSGIIEEQPDYFIFQSSEQLTESYRGTLIIGLPKEMFCVLDLTDRSVEFGVL